MKRVRNLVLIILCVCFSFLSTGCENGTQMRIAHISEITSALSTDHAVRVVLDNDKRMEDKYVDVQIKSNKKDQILTFGEEMEESFRICLAKKDYWYNLNYLISKTNGASHEAGYKKYEDFGNKVYLFSAQNDVDITFRVVVGQIKTNQETKEEILVLSEEISDKVVVKVKTHNKD